MYTQSIRSMFINTVVRGQTRVTNVDTALEEYKTSTMDTNGRKNNKSECAEYIKTFETQQRDCAINIDLQDGLEFVVC